MNDQTGKKQRSCQGVLQPRVEPEKTAGRCCEIPGVFVPPASPDSRGWQGPLYCVCGRIHQGIPLAPFRFQTIHRRGDLVVVHSHLTRKPGDRGMAVMDVFRLENGKIVEHWDVMQEVPETAVKSNTMF